MRIKTVRWGRTLSKGYQGKRFDVEIAVGDEDTPLEALEMAQYLVDLIIETPRPARKTLAAEHNKANGDQLQVIEAMVDGKDITLEE